MGGDTVSFPNSTIYDDNDDDDVSTTEIPTFWPGGLSRELAGENESVIGESDARSFRYHYKTRGLEAHEKRINSIYAQIFKDYDDLKDRFENIEVAKSKVLSYTPGSWIENVGGMTMSDYNTPKTTTLLLIGPKGSGKSSLVNRISRVFEDDKFAPERAQVTYNSSLQDGTCFLQEYMIPRNSTSFCFYDTPGFSSDLFENLEMIKQWMTKGVCHEALVKSGSGSSSLRVRMNCKTPQDKLLTYERRRVGFVIFVINGLSVLKCMDSHGADTRYMDIVTEAFSSPFLSFKDHKPVIAITHGDLLSISERVRVRVYLGDLLGVHPSKQMFDIPDNCEPKTELPIIDLVRYALEHADRNLPCKSRPAISKGATILLWTHLLLLIVVGIFMITPNLYRFDYLKLNPESVPEPRLEIKKVMGFDQNVVPKPDMEVKKVTELDSEIVPEHILEIKKDMELDQEIAPEPDMEIKEVKEFDHEMVTEPDLETKEVTEIDESDVEIKKVMEIDHKIISELDMEITEVTKVDESDLEIKKFTESDPEIVPKHILEMKKVTPESIPKPSKKTKKGDAEKTHGKNQKQKKAARFLEPTLEIDWKTIRHIW